MFAALRPGEIHSFLAGIIDTAEGCIDLRPSRPFAFVLMIGLGAAEEWAASFPDLPGLLVAGV
jgi:hypothetical protein